MNVLGEIIPIVPVSGWLVVGGLLLVFFRLLWTGALVTRNQLDDARKQRDEYKAAVDKLLDTNNIQARQLDALTILGKTGVHALKSLPGTEEPDDDA